MDSSVQDPAVQVVQTSDGTRIAYRDNGTGDPVLLIPGLGYASWSWSHQIDQLRNQTRVVALDNRGTGRSDAPPGPYSIARMADDALAVIAALGEPVHLVGASMGGYIALTLALRHPEQVSSLTLVATTSGGPGSTPVPDSTLRAWAASSVLTPEGYARATMPLSFAPGWVQDHPEQFEQQLALRLRHPTSSRAWRAQFAGCADYLRDGAAAGDLSMPAVIVHGTADRVVPYPNMAHLAARLPNARQVTLPAAGHLCWIEEPDYLTQIIADQAGLGRPPETDRSTH